MIVKRYAANTLIEVLIAMIIVSIVFGFSISILANLQNNSRNQNLAQAYVLAHSRHSNNMRIRKYGTHSFKSGNLTVEERTLPYNHNVFLYEITVICDGGLLYHSKFLKKFSYQINDK